MSNKPKQQQKLSNNLRSTHETSQFFERAPNAPLPARPDPKFYFHPQYYVTQKENLPVTGDLFPVAIPLAEPSRDPSKRLPIYHEENDSPKKSSEWI